MAIFGNDRAKASGVPGVQAEEAVAPEMGAMLLGAGTELPTIGRKDILRAAEILQKYKQGKARLEERIVQDELWWELRHWDVIRRGNTSSAGSPTPEPASAWLFNSICNKHADAMDNYPEPVVLPREQSDEESAKTLSSVVPVVLEQNDYEDTYAANWWEKLKHGTGAYGVFWDGEKENGIGDIAVTQLDLLSIFWEPGITDVQKSRNLFIVDLVDNDILQQQYPQVKKSGGVTIDVKQYIYDDTVDTSDKSVVVDWYYKVTAPDGRTLVHYAKFVGDVLLYASQNDPDYRDRGFYDHGKYPVVFDSLFPEKGTPVGFGYVAICKDPQIYIDKLSANILENSMMTTKKRFFVSNSTGINEEEFLDWSKPLVHVEGELDDRRLKEITTNPLDDIYIGVLNQKIEEMKDTAANRDVNSGSTGSGVTAAAAIAALQEAGNKVSRDMIASSYRAHCEIVSLCIELMRQFYTEDRAFRITGKEPGTYDFISFNNSGLREQLVGMTQDGVGLYRKPIFDLKIKAQKKNPFSRAEQNERAKELYAAGFFNPERAQEAMGALDMMDFEGIDKVKEYVGQGQTLLAVCQQMSQQMDQMALLLQSLTGKDMGVAADSGAAGTAAGGDAAGQVSAGGIDSKIANAQEPMTDYGTRLAARSKPDMSVGSGT